MTHPHTLTNTQTHVLLEASFCWMNSTSSLLFTLFSVPAPLTSRVFTCSNEVPDTLKYTDYHMKTMHDAQFSVPAPFTSRVTLRASLSGTFLQTLPELVTPLKGHSYLHAAVHGCGQRPPKSLGASKTVET